MPLSYSLNILIYLFKEHKLSTYYYSQTLLAHLRLCRASLDATPKNIYNMPSETHSLNHINAIYL